jgi:hypothetical protein
MQLSNTEILKQQTEWFHEKGSDMSLLIIKLFY